MTTLHPIPATAFRCPSCAAPLAADGWYIPGMRTLARLVCPGCGRRWFGDLAAAQGLYTPMLLEEATGEVHDRYGVPWFAAWLRDAYAARSSEAIGFEAEEHRTIARPLLVNCIDKLYGHALLKLLNVQHYLDHHPDLDVIALVPRWLRWLVPAGVAATWTVDVPLRRGTLWNDWLAGEIAARIERFDSCMLSAALPHPHPEDISIERFTGVAPFDEARWEDSARQPVVAFIWRDDRVWSDPPTPIRRLADRMTRTLGARADRIAAQRERVLALADALRRELPALRFAVVGLGTPGDLPAWIEDRRASAIDEAAERAWCALYAECHLVIGVHGSNMLLPSAHAGAVIDLMGSDRWGNYLQDLLPRYRDAREAMIHCRLLPDSMKPADVAAVALSMLRDRNVMMLNLGRAASLHAGADVAGFAERRLRLARRDEGGDA